MELESSYLNNAVDHLEFEVGSLCDYWCRLNQMGEDSDLVIATALYEATLLHGRLLIEFLVGRTNRRKEDLRPADFGVTDDFAHDSEQAVRLSEGLPLLDQYLAHLSKERTKDIKGAAWSSSMLRSDILELVEAFLGRLGTEHAMVAERIRNVTHRDCNKC